MDRCIKFLFEGLPVRGVLVRLEGSWQESLARRAEPPRRTQQQQAGPKKGDLDNDEMESFLNDNFGTGSTGGSGIDD
jgi:hypothetical protein